MSDDESAEVRSRNAQPQNYVITDASRVQVERTPLLPRGKICVLSPFGAVYC